jgi:hypothetical protein
MTRNVNMLIEDVDLLIEDMLAAIRRIKCQRPVAPSVSTPSLGCVPASSDPV